MQDMCANVEKSINNSHSGRARKLTESRDITLVTSKIPPDPGPRFLLLLVLEPQSRKA